MWRRLGRHRTSKCQGTKGNRAWCFARTQWVGMWLEHREQESIKMEPFRWKLSYPGEPWEVIQILFSEWQEAMKGFQARKWHYPNYILKRIVCGIEPRFGGGRSGSRWSFRRPLVSSRWEMARVWIKEGPVQRYSPRCGRWANRSYSTGLWQRVGTPASPGRLLNKCILSNTCWALF